MARSPKPWSHSPSPSLSVTSTVSKQRLTLGGLQMFNTEAREGSSEGGVSGDTHHTLQGDEGGEGDEERCQQDAEDGGVSQALGGWTLLFRLGFYFLPFRLGFLLFLFFSRFGNDIHKPCSVSRGDVEDGVF